MVFVIRRVANGHLQSVPLFRPLSPELVPVGVEGDLEQPPLESRLVSKGIYSFKDPRKNILGEIAAIFVREPAPAKEADDLLLVKIDRSDELPRCRRPPDILDQTEGRILIRQGWSQRVWKVIGDAHARRWALRGDATSGCLESTKSTLKLQKKLRHHHMLPR